MQEVLKDESKGKKIHLYKKQMLVPMTFSDLVRLIAWSRDLLEKGVVFDKAKIMIELVDRLEKISKEEQEKYRKE